MPRSAGASGVALALLLVLTAARAHSAAAQDTCAEVAIRSPFSGMAVRGLVPIYGSARIDRFGFYKLEWAAPHDPESWIAVSNTKSTPVLHGVLDRWDTSRIPDGTYRLRLAVVDETGQEPCRQVVEGVVVDNDPPTEVTATGAVTPTVAIRAARPGELPTVAPAVDERDEADEAAEPAPAAATAADAGTAMTGALAADLVNTDFPIELARAPEADPPEDAPAQDAPEGPQTLDVLDLSSWLAAAGISSWPRAFAGGAAAALLVAVFALAILGYRHTR